MSDAPERIKHVRARGATISQMRANLSETIEGKELINGGDSVLVWVNEDDIAPRFFNRRADLSVAEAARVLLEARNEAKQVPVGARRTPQQVSLMKFKETALRSLAKEPSHD
jgi:hypothetical protein